MVWNLFTIIGEKNYEKESILKLITFMESNKMILQQFYAFLASITRLVSIVMKSYITQLCNTKFDKYIFLIKVFSWLEIKIYLELFLVAKLLYYSLCLFVLPSVWLHIREMWFSMFPFKIVCWFFLYPLTKEHLSTSLLGLSALLDF